MSEEQILQDTQVLSENTDEENQDNSWEESQRDSQANYEEIENDPQDRRQIDPSIMNDTQQADNPDVALDLQSLDLGFVLDIPLQVTVELGRKRILIQDLLKLDHGSVIELNKQVSEPLDILVNQKLIARGEVVVVNDKFGIRITDIISPKERLQQIQ